MGRSSRWAPLATALVCLALVFAVQVKIDSMRTRLVQDNVLPMQLPQSTAVSAALGGFRGLAVDILWIQAENMQNARQFYQLKTLYELISILQPNFPSVWDFNAWNLAYNISAEWGRQEEKWLWIKEGLDFGNKGLVYNPDSVVLWTDLGFMYSNKVGKDDYMSKRFQEAEGIEPYIKASQYCKKALELAQQQGETNPRLYDLYAQALYRHATAVLRDTGNVPEAVDYCGRAAAVVDEGLVLFPDDNGLVKMKADLAAQRTRIGG